MSNLERDHLALLTSADLGVLATIKRDGRPQLSPVNYTYDGSAAEIRISITEGRAAMVADRRLVLSIEIERVFGAAR